MQKTPRYKRKGWKPVQSSPETWDCSQVKDAMGRLQLLVCQGHGS